MIIQERESRSMSEVQLCKETDDRLAQGKGDIVTVKMADMKEVWWITVVHMEVEGPEN